MNKLHINGFDIDTATLEDRVFINIDTKGIGGGYISVKFDNDGIVIDVFNYDGDVINSCWNEYNEFKPVEAVTS